MDESGLTRTLTAIEVAFLINMTAAAATAKRREAATHAQRAANLPIGDARQAELTREKSAHSAAATLEDLATTLETSAEITVRRAAHFPELNTKELCKTCGGCLHRAPQGWVGTWCMCPKTCECRRGLHAGPPASPAGRG